jgi:methyltransferase (TIGR00027 family)
MMVARTVAIDDAIRAAAHPQVVLLGAGLDGRAWRMDELRDAVVYEVDHPDSQRAKRARLGGLTQRAREVRFVAVDFERDDLDAALAAAGHDATRPTIWVWEGVVMYLTVPDIHATLAIIARRSAPESEIAYHAPSPLLLLVGLFVRRLGEPFRSTFTVDAMARTLHAYGFEVTSDESLPAISARLSAELAAGTRHMGHGRVVIGRRSHVAEDVLQDGDPREDGGLRP